MTLSAIGLTNSHIIVGNSSNLGADVAMSGDVTIDNAGVTSIKSSVSLAGSPTTTTQAAGDNSTKIATTAYVDAAVATGAGSIVFNVISGNLPSSMAGTNTTASMTISAGQAADSTNTVYITGAGYSWAVSNGNAINGYQGGTTLPNSSTIHMYLCKGGSGIGVFASTSLTPTLPSGYNTYFRRIFSFKTTAAGAPIPYNAVEVEGGAIMCFLVTQTKDVSSTTLGTSRTTFVMNVPAGIKVELWARAIMFTGAGVIFTGGDETDVAPQAYNTNTVPLYDVAGTTKDGEVPVCLITDTSAQMGIRASTTGQTISVVTRGFKDFRRS